MAPSDYTVYLSFYFTIYDFAHEQNFVITTGYCETIVSQVIILSIVSRERLGYVFTVSYYYVFMLWILKMFTTIKRLLHCLNW